MKTEVTWHYGSHYEAVTVKVLTQPNIAFVLPLYSSFVRAYTPLWFMSVSVSYSVLSGKECTHC
jgi:hypothetical protein